MMSTDEKMIPDVMIQSERACLQFPSARTWRDYVLRVSRRACHVIMRAAIPVNTK